MIARTLFVFAAATTLSLTGCRKGQIESYRIPKEKDPEMPLAGAGNTTSSAPADSAGAAPAPASNAMANTAVPTAEGAGLTWTAPASWHAKQTSAMRKGSYTVPGNGGEADLSITAFPGDVGGELANVNRWRGQVQLPPIDEGDLTTAVQRFESNGLKFGLVDAVGAGANPQRILGAFVPLGGATWFFKLAGPNAVIESAKSDFLAFLRTVKPATFATQ